DEQPNETLRGRSYDQKPFWDIERARLGSSREVPLEVVVNGKAIAKKNIIADGSVQDVVLEVPIEQSSWVALRILPSSHTNPLFVIVNDKPIRSSRRSAEWCLKAVDQCWNQKVTKISARERDEAEKAYDHARQVYRQILSECQAD